LDGAAGSALVQIVDHRHDSDGIAVGHGAQVRIIAGRHILDAGCGVADANEGAVLVVGLEGLQGLRRADRFLETGLHGDVDAAREGSRVRHEIELRFHSRGELGAGDDFRHVAMTQGAVAVEIAMPMRMMRAIDRLAA
jgi:hypothetical protein